MKWSRVGSITVAVVLIALFCANIPQSAAANGVAIVQNEITRVLGQVDRLNGFFVQEGYTPSQFVAVADYASANPYEWHVRLERHTPIQHFTLTTTDVWSDAAAHQHGQHQGEWTTTGNLTLVLANLDPDGQTIRWTNPAYSGGYRAEPLWYFRERLHADSVVRRAQTGTSLDQPLDTAAQRCLTLLNSSASSPGQQASFIDALNAYFRRLHRTAYRWYVRGVRPGVFTLEGYRRHPYQCSEPLQLVLGATMQFILMPDGVYHPWRDFLSSLCREEGVGLFDPDLRVAVVTNGQADDSRIADMLQEAAAQGEIYATVDVFDPSNFRVLFGSQSGVNDPWILENNWQYPSFPLLGDFVYNTPQINDYQLVWVASAPNRSQYELGRWEQMVLSNWLRTVGGTLVVGGRRSGGLETWTAHQSSYTQFTPIDWFETGVGSWVNELGGSCWLLESTSAGYVGKGLQMRVNGPGQPYSFSLANLFPNTPIQLGANPQLHFWVNSSVGVTARASVLWSDAIAILGIPMADTLDVVSLQLNATNGKWAEVTWDVNEAATLLHGTEWGSPDQLLALRFDYSYDIHPNDYFVVDEVCARTGKAVATDAFMDVQSRHFGFGESFSTDDNTVMTWQNVTGSGGYSNWQVDFTDGQAIFHVWAAAPTPGVAPGPYPPTTTSTWWEVQRGPTWIEYLNTTLPTQKRRTTGLDLTNLGTVEAPRWVQDSEYAPSFIVETTNHSVWQFADPTAFQAVVTAYPTQILAIGLQTSRATAGFALDPSLPYALGQLLYGPRLPDRTLPSLGTAMFHVLPRVHAQLNGTWLTTSLAQVNRQYWQNASHDPRYTVQAKMSGVEGWMEVSYRVDSAGMLGGLWSYVVTLRTYRDSPHPRLKLQLTCHSAELQDLGVSYDMIATGWRPGYNLTELAVRPTATASEDRYLVTTAQDVATRYATLNPQLRLLCQNQEGFLLDLTDMVTSGFKRPRLQILDVQLPLGGTRRVVQAGMTGYGRVAQNTPVVIDPTLIAYGTTVNDDLYASKDSAGLYEGAADSILLRLGVDDHLASDWYNAAWGYRKSHVLSSTAAQTNYQVKIAVKRQTGTSTGGTVYVGTNCRTDFADLRFTKADGLTLLDYWLESKDSTSATFWVEVPSLVVGSTTIYVYYGNPSASSASNGDATFLFFDDFTTWNAGKWSVTEYSAHTHSRNVTNGELWVYALSSLDPSGYYLRTTGSWSEANVALYAKTRWANLDNYRGGGEFLGVHFVDGGGQWTGETVSLYGDYRTYLYRWRDGATDPLDPDGMVQGPTSGNAYFTFTKMGSTWGITLSGTWSHTWSGSITTVTTPYRLQLDAYVDAWGPPWSDVRTNSYFDYLYLRKYASTEPTHGTWGSEQPITMLKRANRLLTRFSIAGLPHSPVQRIDSAFLFYPIDSSGGTHSHTVWAIRTTNASWDSATNAARWSWATTGTSVAATVGSKLSFNVTSHVQALYDANATLAAWKLWLDNDAAFSYLDWYLVRSNYLANDRACLNITYSEKPFAPTVANTAILGMEDDGGWGGPNWLDLGWQYRKNHTLTGSTSGALTDYQVRVRVYYGSGTDSGDTVYCGGRCQSDFDDIRFTAADGTTLLSHWRESYTVGTSAIFWVKLPSIPASPSTVTFYVYYGNGAASSASDIGATMVFGDDFGGTSLDLGKWTPTEYTGGSHYYQLTSTGELRVHAESWDAVTSGYTFASVPTWSLTNLAVVVKGRWANLDYVRGGGDFLGGRIRDAAADETGYSLGLRGDYKVNLWRYPDYPTNSLVEWNPADYAAGNATITLTKLGTAWTLSLAGTYTDSWSGTLTVSTPYALRLSSSLQYWTDPVAGDTYFDYVYVRNYASGEPTHGSWGAQEGGGTGTVNNCYATHTYSVQTRVTDLNKWQNVQWVNVSIGTDVKLTYHYYFNGQSWVQELSPSGTVVNTSTTTLQITWTFTPTWGTSVNGATVTSQAKDSAGLVGQETLSAYVDLIRELRLDGYTADDTHVNSYEVVTFSGQVRYQAAGGVPNRWYSGWLQVGYESGGQFASMGWGYSRSGAFTAQGACPAGVAKYAVYPRVNGTVTFSGQAIDVTVDRLVLEASQLTDPDGWVNSGTLFQWTFRCKYAYSGAYIGAFTMWWNGQPSTAVGGVVNLEATGYDQMQSFAAVPVNDNADGIIVGNCLNLEVVWTRVLAVAYPSEQSLNWSAPVYVLVRAWWAHDGSPYSGQLTLSRNGTSLGSQVFVEGWSRWTQPGFAANTTCTFNATSPVNTVGVTALTTNGTWCAWRPDGINDEDYDGLPDAWEVQYGYALYPAESFYLSAVNATDWTSDYDGDGIPAYVEYEVGSSPVSASSPGLVIGECASEVFTSFTVTDFPFLELRASGTPNALLKVLLCLGGAVVWDSGWLDVSSLQTLRFTPNCTWVDRVKVVVRSLDGVNATVWLDWLQLYHPNLVPRPLAWIGQVHQNPSLAFVSDIGGLKGTVPNVLPSGLVNTPAEYGIDVGATLPGWWVEQMGWGGLMPGAVFRDYLTSLSDLMNYVSRATRSAVYQWEGGWSPVEEEQFAPSAGTTTAVYQESSLLLNLSVAGQSIGCWVGDAWNASMPLRLTTSLGILDPINTSLPAMGYGLSVSKLDAHAVRVRLEWANNGSLSYEPDAFRGTIAVVQAAVSDVGCVGLMPEPVVTNSCVTFTDQCTWGWPGVLEFTVEFTGGYANNTWSGATLPWLWTPVGFTSPWGGGVAYLTTYIYSPQPLTLDNTTIISCQNDFGGVYANSYLTEAEKNALWTTRAWLNGIELNRTVRTEWPGYCEWPGYDYVTPRFSLLPSGLTLKAGFNQLLLRFDVSIPDELLVAQAAATGSLANGWTVESIQLIDGWGVTPQPEPVPLRCQGDNPYVTYPEYALANVAVEHGQILFYGYLDAADPAPWTLAEREGLYGLKADGSGVRNSTSDSSCAGKAFVQNIVEEVAKQFDQLFLAGRHYAGALVGTGIQPTEATAEQTEALCTQLFQTGIELRSAGENIALLNEWRTQFNTLLAMWGSQPEWGGLEIIVPGDVGTSTVWFEATTRDPWYTGRRVDAQGWLIDGEDHHYVAIWARWLPPWYSTWSEVWYRVYSDLRVVREEGETAHPSGWYDLFDNVADGTPPDPPTEQEPEHPCHNPFFNHESSFYNQVSMGHLANETGLQWQMWYTNAGSFGGIFSQVFGLFDLIGGIIKDIWISPLLDTITAEGLLDLQRLMYLMSLRTLNATDFTTTPDDEGTILESPLSGYWQGFLSLMKGFTYTLNQAGTIDVACKFMTKMALMRGTPIVMRFDMDADVLSTIRLASVPTCTMTKDQFVEWCRAHDSTAPAAGRYLDWGQANPNEPESKPLGYAQGEFVRRDGKPVEKPTGGWGAPIPERSRVRLVGSDAQFLGQKCYHETYSYDPVHNIWGFDIRNTGSDGQSETAALRTQLPALQEYITNDFTFQNLGIEYRQSFIIAVVPNPGLTNVKVVKAAIPVAGIIVHNGGQPTAKQNEARLRWALIGDVRNFEGNPNQLRDNVEIGADGVPHLKEGMDPQGWCIPVPDQPGVVELTDGQPTAQFPKGKPSGYRMSLATGEITEVLTNSRWVLTEHGTWLREHVLCDEGHQGTIGQWVTVTHKTHPNDSWPPAQENQDLEPSGNQNEEQVSTATNIPTQQGGRVSVITVTPGAGILRSTVESILTPLKHKVSELEHDLLQQLHSNPSGLDLQSVGDFYEQTRLLFTKMGEVIGMTNFLHQQQAVRYESKPGKAGIVETSIKGWLHSEFSSTNWGENNQYYTRGHLKFGWRLAQQGQVESGLREMLSALSEARIQFEEAMRVEVPQLTSKIDRLNALGYDVHAHARKYFTENLRYLRATGDLFDRDSLLQQTRFTGECRGTAEDRLAYTYFLLSMYDPQMDSEKVQEHMAAYFVGEGIYDTREGPKPSQLLQMLDLIKTGISETLRKGAEAGYASVKRYLDDYLVAAGYTTDFQKPDADKFDQGTRLAVQQATDRLATCLTAVENLERILAMSGGQAVVATSDQGRDITLAEFLWGLELVDPDTQQPVTLDGVQLYGLGIGQMIDMLKNGIPRERLEQALKKVMDNPDITLDDLQSIDPILHHNLMYTLEGGNSLSWQGLLRFFARDEHDAKTQPDELTRKALGRDDVTITTFCRWLVGGSTPDPSKVRDNTDKARAAMAEVVQAALRFDIQGFGDENKASFFELLQAQLNIAFKTIDALQQRSILAIETGTGLPETRQQHWAAVPDPSQPPVSTVTTRTQFLRALNEKTGRELEDIWSQPLGGSPGGLGGSKQGVSFQLQQRVVGISTVTDVTGALVEAKAGTLWKLLGIKYFDLSEHKLQCLREALAYVGPEFSSLMQYKLAAHKFGVKPVDLQSQITYRIYSHAVNVLLGPDFLKHAQERNVYPNTNNPNNKVKSQVAKLVGCIGLGAGICLAATSFLGYSLPKFFGSSSKPKAAGFRLVGGGVAVGVNTMSQLSGGVKDNTFVFQLVWAPLGAALGAALTTAVLQNTGRFDSYFDPLDGAEWTGTGWAWIKPGPCDGCFMPEITAQSPYASPEEARNYELGTQLAASWAWAWVLSFLTWFTDYLELSSMDLSLELVNCIVGGFQTTCASIFHQALYDVAVEPGNTYKEQDKWWHHDVQFDKGSWWSYQPLLPSERLVPSFDIKFENIFVMLRHLLCYPTWQEISDHSGTTQEDQDWRAKYGVARDPEVGQFLPPYEPNAGCLLLGFGRHEWDDYTVGALIWDGIGQVIMWSLGACCGFAFQAGGGFLSSIAAIFGSMAANYLAGFLIQQLLSWRAKGILAEILLEIITQSVAEPDDLSETDPEDPSTCRIANARYMTWSR